ncbi:hypothetical protein FDENT_11406 [Fusarium denticulatum]|uniref:Uncharacterized protein n=1 Tax=Fusarium denticulatum TaxID=48507 RepID=A0A8H5TH31_9HYPO|nr:hypothetical protein FDENT_11406 [Fusarium denticulatum]
MTSHREGVRNRLQPKDVNAVKDQFFQKRRSSSAVDVLSSAPRSKRVRTAGTSPTIEVASSSNIPAAATESNDEMDLPLDPALLQISAREPAQPLLLDTRDASTSANTEKIKDFLTESGTQPDRPQSLPSTRDSTTVCVPSAANIYDSFDFSHVRPSDLLAGYKDIHQRYNTALQDAKTQSNHSLAVLQKQLEEAHRAADEFSGKIEEADTKKDAAAAKATEAKETIDLIQDFLGSSRRFSRHSSIHGLEEILTQQRNILSESKKALEVAEKTANKAASEKSSAETKLTEANTKVTKLKEMIRARKTSAVYLDNESEHATRVAKLAQVGGKGSRVLQDMFPAFFKKLDEIIQESSKF